MPVAVLTIKLFGNPAVFVDGREVTLPYRRAEALLYYLLLNRKAARSELVDLLWTDGDTATALKNLRHAIYTIRKRLECDLFLPGQRSMLEIDPSVDVRCDVLEFLEKDDLSVCGSNFLEGFSLPGADLFEEWMEEQRNLLQTRYLKKLLEAEQKALKSGDLSRAEQYGLEYVDRDPLDENAAVALMEIYLPEEIPKGHWGLP